MYVVSGKLLSGIKSRYVNNIAWLRVNEGERECFRIDSGARQVWIMSPWLFNLYIDVVMKEVKIRMRKRGESGDCLNNT